MDSVACSRTELSVCENLFAIYILYYESHTMKRGWVGRNTLPPVSVENNNFCHTHGQRESHVHVRFGVQMRSSRTPVAEDLHEICSCKLQCTVFWCRSHLVNGSGVGTSVIIYTNYQPFLHKMFKNHFVLYIYFKRENGNGNGICIKLICLRTKFYIHKLDSFAISMALCLFVLEDYEFVIAGDSHVQRPLINYNIQRHMCESDGAIPIHMEYIFFCKLRTLF